jgi:hypothetical protein
MDKINSIVNDIIQGKLKQPKIVFDGLVSNIPESEFDLEQRELIKGILTDFVNNNFLSTITETNKLLETVFIIILPAIELYIKKMKLNENDIVFYYKGGNVMKRIYSNFSYEVMGKITDKVNEYYGEGVFGRSDNDFQILVNPFIENYDKIYEDVNNMIYYLLNYVRDIIRKNETFYFKFFNLNEIQRNGLYRQVINEINEKSKVRIKDISIGKTGDKYLEFNENEKDIKIYSIPNTENYLTISYNTALKFEREVEYVHFNLIRSKINFRLVSEKQNEITNIGGEHIDISISRNDDGLYESYGITDSQKFYQFVKDYIYKNRNVEGEYNYNVMNTRYIIEDLLKVLFSEDVWTNKKYEKRIKRLFSILLFDQLLNIKLDNKNISEIQLKTNKLMNDINKNKLSEIDKNIDKINNYLYNQINKYDGKKFNKQINTFKEVVLRLLNANYDILETIKKVISDFEIKDRDIYNITKTTEI